MKKLLITIGLILVFIIGSGVFLKIKGTDLLHNAIEKNGSEMLGAQILLDDISLDLLAGHMGVSNLSIGQPAGFGDDKSFSVENFTVSLEPLSLFKDHAKIDSILIDKPMLNLVMTDKGTNFTKLQSNIESATDSDSSSEMKISIRRFDLNQTNLRIKSDKYGEKQITLANVHLENIGVDENGIPPKEVARLAMNALKPQIAKALVELGIKDKLGGEINRQLDKQLKDLPAPVTDKLKSGIGGLFKKKKKDEGG